jgi:hypothetical protein
MVGKKWLVKGQEAARILGEDISTRRAHHRKSLHFILSDPGDSEVK